MKQGLSSTHTTLLEQEQSSLLHGMAWLYPHGTQQGAITYSLMKNGIWLANNREGKAPGAGSAAIQRKLKLGNN